MRTVTFTIRPDGRLDIKFPYDESIKDMLKIQFGARFDSERKSWHVQGSPSITGQISDLFDDWHMDLDAGARELFERAELQDQAAAMKTAAGEDLDEIPGKMPAWEHQKQAYHWAAPRIGAGFAIDMGGGKSRLGVSLSDGAWKPKRGSGVIILAPRSVVRVWPNQFAIHSERTWSPIVPLVSKPIKDRVALIDKDLRHANATSAPWVVIINYEAAWRPGMKELLIRLADTGANVLFDESHRIKAPGGKASMFCATLGEHARRAGGRCGAKTGTPMPHGPEDIYAQSRAIDPGVFGTSFNRFKNRYCVMGGFENRQIVAYQREAEFAAKLAELWFFWDKPMPEVPPVDTTIPFRLGPKSTKAYVTLEQDFILGVENSTVTPANALVKLLRLQQITGGFVGDDDGGLHEVGTEKIDAFKDWLQDYPADRPLVVFARFTKDIELLQAALEESGRRVGIVSGKVNRRRFHPQTGEEIQPFYGLNEHSQMREDLDAVILQLQSGGVGIDLTRASTSVYYSLDFNLGNYLQSRARTDRPGQTQHVNYVHFVAEDTKDEQVYIALQLRLDVVTAIINMAREEKGMAPLTGQAFDAAQSETAEAVAIVEAIAEAEQTGNVPDGFGAAIADFNERHGIAGVQLGRERVSNADLRRIP